MIFLLAGTSDARALAQVIQHAGYPVQASVVTEHAAVALRTAGIPTRVGRLDVQGMADAMFQAGAQVVVDASHPFAEEAHRTAMAAAETLGIPYIRFERTGNDGQQGVLWVDSYEDAANVAAEKGGSILLTTGGKTLPVFAKRLLNQPNLRLVIRLLPRVDNLQMCAELGIPQENIVAMQGPFSYELNRALYAHFRTTLMITKDSGEPGAVDEKVQAALDAGVEVVVIRRPKLDYGICHFSVDAVMAELANHLPLPKPLMEEKGDGNHVAVSTRNHPASGD